MAKLGRMRRPRFRTLAHAADVRVAIWGDDEDDLIGNAVLAATTLALGRLPRAAPSGRAAIRPWPRDLPSRLVRVVNEVLFRLYARRELAVGFERDRRGARLVLAPLPAGFRPASEIKAATWHDLRPRPRGGRLSAVMTLDV